MKSIMEEAFDPVHQVWMKYPGRAAIASVTWYFVVLIESFITGRMIDYKSVNGIAHGFLTSFNWGGLYLFAMPTATLLLSALFRALSNSLITLDKIIIGTAPEEGNFSDHLKKKLNKYWLRLIVPVSALLSIALTICADGIDIFSPLTGNSSKVLDWSNQNPSLAFNTLAWSMQIYLIYCALVALILVSYAFYLVFVDGLDGDGPHKWFRFPNASQHSVTWKVTWDFTDSRCGLRAIDAIFMTFTFISMAILVFSAVSILWNTYNLGGPDNGSLILAIFSSLLFPLLLLFIYFPYFSNFPKQLPTNLEGKPKYQKPSPWPFGSEKFAPLMVGILIFLWGVCFLNAIEAVFPGFRIDGYRRA